MKVQELSITFEQESDSCDPQDLGQTLKISTEYAGEGKYLVIETQRWAIDNNEELIEYLTKAREVLKMLEGEEIKQEDQKTIADDLKTGDTIECNQYEYNFTKKARYRIDNIRPSGEVVVKNDSGNRVIFSREVFDEVFTKLDFKPKDIKIVKGEKLKCIASFNSFSEGYKYKIQQLSFNNKHCPTAWITNDEGVEVEMHMEELNLYFENEHPISSLNQEQSKAYMEHLMHKPCVVPQQKDIEIDKLQNSRSGLLGLNDEKIQELRNT